MNRVVVAEIEKQMGQELPTVESPILHEYKNGGYHVSLHSDGTKLRHVVDPTVPPLFPEQMDLKITDWCDAGCSWCHERSTRRGAHGDIDAMLGLLKALQQASKSRLEAGTRFLILNLTGLSAGYARSGSCQV